MPSDSIKNYKKYKRELQSAILEQEDVEYLEELIKWVNIYRYKIHSLDDFIKDTKDKYILHYQAGRRLPVHKDSAIGIKLQKEMNP